MSLCARSSRQSSIWVVRLTLLSLVLAFSPANIQLLYAQSQSGEQAPPASAGGPTGDVGPMAIPQKRQEAPPPPPPKPETPKDMPEYSIRVDVPLVTVPVSVVTKDGQFIPGLKPGNFRIYEDGIEQKILNATRQETGITAVLLVEFAYNNWSFMYDALNASYAFANSLKKEDWVAVVSFDLKPHIMVDFTQDKNAIYAALNSMTMQPPAFREVNVYDALYDTLDRIEEVEGRKYIVLITSGCDTFSRINFDTILKKVKASQNTIIYPISTGKALLIWAEARGGGQQGGLMPCSDNMDFLAADAQMKAYASATGGKWFAPRFQGELPEIFGNIAADIRNEYVVSYRPSNTKQDGSYRKLKVELVGPDGSPLKVKDQKGKDVKYAIVTREGYTAKHEVE